MQKMVVGFAFTPSGNVVLIKKQRPKWQKGLLNGVGGKLEPGESSSEAMIREFQEETSVQTEDWVERGVMLGKGWMVHVFTITLSDEQFNGLTSTTDEQILICPFPFQDASIAIENLPALIELCRMPIGSSEIVPYFNLFY